MALETERIMRPNLGTSDDVPEVPSLCTQSTRRPESLSPSHLSQGGKKKGDGRTDWQIVNSRSQDMNELSQVQTKPD